ncbi:hypothetical protein [Paenarthrobacter nicotinovorans]|uniref:hypothetical protein n=1 Tax=Paenarthrobacter nicotinovorans TaxID=29320 RepID=UPI0006FD926E
MIELPTANPGLAKQLGVAIVEAEASTGTRACPESAATADPMNANDNNAILIEAAAFNLNLIAPPTK